jgi:hypothetical protein
MSEMLPANTDDPRFAEEPEPLAARLAEGAVNSVEDVTSTWAETMGRFGVQFVALVLEVLAHR